MESIPQDSPLKACGCVTWSVKPAWKRSEKSRERNDCILPGVVPWSVWSPRVSAMMGEEYTDSAYTGTDTKKLKLITM